MYYQFIPLKSIYRIEKSVNTTLISTNCRFVRTRLKEKAESYGMLKKQNTTSSGLSKFKPAIAKIVEASSSGPDTGFQV